jgi:hypothetical protein
MNSNSLMSALGLTQSIVNISENKEVSKEVETDNPILHDYDLVRTNLIQITKDAMENIDNLKDLAERSQSNKFYEALNQGIKIAVDANKAIMEVHREAMEIYIRKKQSLTPKEVNNNTLILTTAELQKFLQSNNEVKTIDDQSS